MRVITLDNIRKYIEDTHGKQSIKEIAINGEESSKIIIIKDKGTNTPVAYLNHNDELEFEKMHDRVHCVLLDSDLEKFKSERYLTASRVANGYLCIDNKTMTVADISKYLE